MAKTLQQWQDEIGAWGDATFNQTPQSVLAHLLSELRELWEEMDPVKRREECADVLSLMLNLAHTEGWSLDDALDAKFAINRARTWAKNDAGFHEHVESTQQP